jgi:hypothetical protein
MWRRSPPYSVFSLLPFVRYYAEIIFYKSINKSNNFLQSIIPKTLQKPTCSYVAFRFLSIFLRTLLRRVLQKIARVIAENYKKIKYS